MTVVLITCAALIGFILGAFLAFDLIGAALNRALKSGALFIRQHGRWYPHDPRLDVWHAQYKGHKSHD